ncbi:MAG: hypothetical protein GY862_20375 [Gammaproteobacteria bacterium]|nr:hypothetical protein [Gammaproteobacteria bacterium]
MKNEKPAAGPCPPSVLKQPNRVSTAISPVAALPFLKSWAGLSRPPRILERIKRCRIDQSKDLNLSKQKLRVVPEEVFALTWLESLDLSNNHLQSVPTEIGSLRALKKLDLRDNPLQSPPPDLPGLWLDKTQFLKFRDMLTPQHIAGLSLRLSRFMEDFSWEQVLELPGLTSLDLSHNNLIDLPEAVTWLQNLTSLDLSWDHLSDLPEAVSRLQNLTSLDLRFNLLLTDLPEAVTRLQNLTSLNLYTTGLSDLPETISRLQNLTSLDLAMNHLSDLPKAISRLQKLTSLDLHMNNLSDLPEAVTRLQNLTSLHLDANHLSDLPETVSQLQNLTSLHLGNNRLSTLPEAVTRLQNLTSLSLGDRLSTLPDTVSRLQNLTQLDLTSNQLSDLSEAVSRLQNLTSLFLGHNQLSCLPEAVTRLQNLTSLTLEKNQLGDLPETLSRLQNLTFLNLGKNQLSNLPEAFSRLQNLTSLDLRENQLSELPEALVRLPLLSRLELAENPFNRPPMEVVGQGIEAIRTYFDDLRRGKTRNREAKLILAGNGRTGKTSISRRLIDNSFDPEENSTHGIRLMPYSLSMADGTELKINTWDFGGQELFHATHRFFFTARTLYMLVWDTETLARAEVPDEAAEETHKHEYWLEQVRTLGRGSPVIMVRNKIDLGPGWVDNQSELAQSYNVKAFCEVSASANKNIDALRQHLCDCFGELRDIIGYDMPISWQRVRERLAALASSQNTLEYDEYLKVCAEEQLDETSAATLCAFLHDTAAVLHFASAQKLRGTVIINPRWATELVYKILDQKVKQREGRFDAAHVATLLPDFDAKQREQFIELLEKFELCYVAPGEPENYIAPQFLPAERPSKWLDMIWQEQDRPKMLYRYRYFIHKSVMVRFLARFGADAAEKNVYWRHGILIRRGVTLALIERRAPELEISVSLQGGDGLLPDIMKAFEEINRDLGVEAFAPCVCVRCQKAKKPYPHPHRKLLDFWHSGTNTVQCDLSGEILQIRDLLPLALLERKRSGRADKNTFIRGENNKREETYGNSMMKELSFEQKQRVKELLLACPSINNSGSRSVLIRELPPHIANAIEAGDNAQTHVLNIVTACMAHDNGLALLIDRLRFFDGATIPFRELTAFVDQLPERKDDPKHDQKSPNDSPREVVTVQPASSAKPVDSLLIVTVTKTEARAVLENFSQASGSKWTRRVIEDKTYYNLGVHGGAPVFMVQSDMMGIAGPGGSLLTVHQAIQDLKPQAVILCGIAFGLYPRKQQLGDILIAQQVLYYEAQKTDIQRGKIPLGDRVTVSVRLLDRFRSGDMDWPGAPTHFGLVLSGEKLVNAPDLRDWFVKTEPKAIGGEMEGAGLYAAAHKTKVDWIVVKAICDWADGSKNDDAQALAARNAAQFVLHVLQSGEWKKAG